MNVSRHQDWGTTTEYHMVFQIQVFWSDNKSTNCHLKSSAREFRGQYCVLQLTHWVARELDTTDVGPLEIHFEG